MKTLLKLLICVSVSLSIISCGGGSSSSSSSSPSSPTALGEYVIGADQLTVNLYDPNNAVTPLSSTIPGVPITYERSGSTVTVTMNFHNIPNTGGWVTLNFGSGTGGSATSGNYFATVVDPNIFTITDSASGTVTSGSGYLVPITSLAGTYSQSAVAVTVTLNNHGFSNGNVVTLNALTGSLAKIIKEVTVVDSNTFTVTANESATTSGDVSVGIGTNYIATDIAIHPNGRWVYISSQYDCYNGSPYCWGRDVITQFEMNWTTGVLTPVNSYRTRLVSGSGANDAAPVKMIINGTGTNLVHQCDNLDGLVLWSIDSTTGALNILAESAQNTTNEHGISFSADGQYVYHGTRTFTVGANAISLIASTSPTANSSHIYNGVLIGTTTRSGGSLIAFDLTDPAAPVASTPFSLSSLIRAREISYPSSQGVTVASGFGGLKSFVYSGGVFSAAAPSSGSAELTYDGASTLSTDTGAVNMMYRSIASNDARTKVVASFFNNGNQADIGGSSPSGFMIANVGSDGALTLVGSVTNAQYARAAKFFKRPGS